jgi:hypothetical protein
MEARRRAVEALTIRPAHILVDGKHRIAGCHISQTSVIDGDALSVSVAAASIVAKVTRDSIMEEYARLFPEYGFEGHKGYGTVDHMRALTHLGPLPYIVGHLPQCGERIGHNGSLHSGASIGTTGDWLEMRLGPLSALTFPNATRTPNATHVSGRPPEANLLRRLNLNIGGPT